MTAIAPHDILAYWTGLGPDRWFEKDAAVDAEIAARFRAVHERAAAGGLAAWEATADGALALTIVLDQFPRNMYRGDARAFASDPLARDVSRRALAQGFDTEVDHALRRFFYLPLMHSETREDQERCIVLFSQIDEPDSAKFAAIHADIIRRFGRFPHRNAILGRATTPDEQAFLDSGGFSG